MNAADRRELFLRLKQANPAPTTELRYTTPFELLVAVILSAQSTDKGVNKATEKLFQIANTPQQILDLGLRGLKRYVKTIGLFNTKASTSSRPANCWSNGTAARCRRPVRSWRPCPGWAARPRTWCSTPLLATRPSPWTRISSVLPTAPGLRPAKTVRAVEDKLNQVVPEEFRPRCAPLADPARPLHLRRAASRAAGSCVIFDLCSYKDKVTE